METLEATGGAVLEVVTVAVVVSIAHGQSLEVVVEEAEKDS